MKRTQAVVSNAAEVWKEGKHMVIACGTSPEREAMLRATIDLDGRFLPSGKSSPGSSINSLTNGSVHRGRLPNRCRDAVARRMQAATPTGIAEMTGRKHFSNRASTGSYPNHHQFSFWLLTRRQ